MNHKSPMIICRQFLYLLLVFAAVPVNAAEALIPHTAEYKVKISVVGGRLKTELRQTDAGYVAKHSIAPSGLSKLIARGKISEIAEFGVDDRGVIPMSYATDDTLDDDEVHAKIEFDWEAKEASGTMNDQELVTALDGLTHDRISIQYALMHDLLNDDLGTEYRMFELDELRQVNVRLVGNKKVKVPAGTFDAIGIQHQAENSSRTMTLWCVEELGYLPVVIQQHRKGKLRVEAKLREYSPLAASTENDSEL